MRAKVVSAMILLAVGIGLISLAYPAATITSFRTDTIIATSTSTIAYVSTITNSNIQQYTESYPNGMWDCYMLPVCNRYETHLITYFYMQTTPLLLVAKSTQTQYQTVSIPQNVPLYAALGLSSLQFAVASVVILAILIFLLMSNGTISRRLPSSARIENPNKLFCINCGVELPKGSKFCNRCGTKQP